MAVVARSDGAATGVAPWAVDALLGAGLAATLALLISAGVAGSRPDGLAYAWAAGVGALMLARRRYPVAVVVLTVVSLFAYYALGYPAVGVAVPVAPAVFSAAERRRLTTAVVASVVVLAGSSAYRVATGQDAAYVLGFELVGHALLLAAAVALGDALRARREVQRSARQVARLTADRLRRRMEAASDAERLATARDLHDTVGHALAVVSIHAQVAEEAVGHDDDAAARALAVVRATTTETFAELRRVVAALRRTVASPRPPAAVVDVTTATRPAVDAGIEVHADVDLPADLPGPVAAAAHRIVQEAVTNVVRHSRAARLDVVVRAGAGALEVLVADDGGGATSDDVRTVGPATGGHGILGMQERAAALGGWVTAGPATTGWQVRASIPTGAGP
ncbi:sensor histidine kinase [Cellulomonas telluris]|uniref:sensor histidine kinase n=1 Tax=Cellulomonas telluris TaxID=2306636 RepID=UPI0010A82E97|nr:histidine kinase [Cellulomonas telluris]